MSQNTRNQSLKPNSFTDQSQLVVTERIGRRKKTTKKERKKKTKKERSRCDEVTVSTLKLLDVFYLTNTTVICI